MHRGLVALLPCVAQQPGRLAPALVPPRCSRGAPCPPPLAHGTLRRRLPLHAVLRHVRLELLCLQPPLFPLPPLLRRRLLLRERGARRFRSRLALPQPAALPPPYRLPRQPRRRIELSHDLPARGDLALRRRLVASPLAIARSPRRRAAAAALLLRGRPARLIVDVALRFWARRPLGQRCALARPLLVTLAHRRCLGRLQRRQHPAQH